MMNKLIDGHYVDLKKHDVSKEVFDAMVAVAVASGIYTDCAMFGYRYLVIVNNNLNSVKGSYGDNYVKNLTELTPNEWLFSLAPEWAVDLSQYDGVFAYTDGKEKVFDFDSVATHWDWDGRVVIATREQQRWIPDVGDECLAQWLLPPDGGSMEPVRVLINSIIGNKVWFDAFENGGDIVESVFNVSFKQLPPEPTEEENQLIDALKKLNNQYHDQVDYYPVMTKELIKAGYRKVEPLSFAEFDEKLITPSRMLAKIFRYLSKGKHIIVKDGE